MSDKSLNERFFGAHVSVAGGLEKAVEAATRLNINTVQVHPTPPQKWNTKPVTAGLENAFLAARPASPLKKIFFHGIYLINLATAEKQKAKLAVMSLANDLDLSARIAGDGVIFHVGSAKSATSLEEGLTAAAGLIDEALAETPEQSRLILEVAAGSGQVIGSKVEELATIFEQIKNKSRVGFGLDSQHLWASGYDLQNHLEESVAKIVSTFGRDKIWSLHLNDSMTALGSRKDRHANIGEGQIGREALRKLVQHPELRDVPIILETPGLKEPETAAKEVAALRELIAA